MTKLKNMPKLLKSNQIKSTFIVKPKKVAENLFPLDDDREHILKLFNLELNQN